MKPTLHFPLPARMVLLLFPLFFATGAGAADLVTEDFDTSGEGTDYFSSHFSDGEDFFERSGSNPDPRHNAGGFSGFTFTAPQGFGYWASEDIEDTNNPLGDHGIVRLADIDTTGFNNLQVRVFFAQTDNRFDIGDKIEVQYAFDGNSGGTNLAAGTYTTIGRFIGSGPSIFDDGAMQQDADLNGFVDPGGAQLTQTMTEYSFSIPAVGASLSVQIRIEQNGGSEELAFDHIRVSGEVAVTDPPVLAGIEGDSIAYTESDAATPVTNTITLSDPDSSQLTGATVRISGNYVSTEDVLDINSPPGGLSANFNTSTGALNITGMASLADYQAALRLLTYENTNDNNPSTATRTVQFQVDDGTSPSNFQTRDIEITGTIGTGTIPHTESLETDGEGERYTSSAYNAGGGDLFERTDNSNPDLSGNFISVDGSFFWASEDIDSTGNPLGNHGILRLQELNASGLTNLQVTVSLAEIAPTAEANDKIEIQYAFDGNSGGDNISAGSYTTIGRFVPDSPSAFTPGPMKLDSDLDGITNGDPEDTGSATLTSTMTDYTFDIPATGNLLSIQIRVQQNGGGEEIGFDYIRVTATAGGDPPVLADIEPGTIGYTEGDPATQVTNTITVADADDADIESATVRISGNYVAAEDVLAVASPPAGLTIVPFNAGTGILEFTGTAPLADYQAALRLVTYQNTNGTNPSTATRTVQFQVDDGDSPSNFETRDIEITQQPFDVGLLPYTEAFDSEGEGVRYTSSSYNADAGSGDFFERTDTNPHPEHSGGFTFTPPQGGGFWAGEDIDSAGNPLGDHGVVRLTDLDVTGVTELKVSLFLAQTADLFDLEDKIEIQYALDGNRGGTDLAAGTYTTVGRFVGAGDDIFSDGAMQEDADLDGNADAGGSSLTPAMTEYTFSIPATGDLLSIQVRVQQNGGGEELAFDHIRIEGVGPPVIRSTPVTTGTVGALYTYDVEATDPAGDTLTFSLDTAPAGMTIDPASGLIQWTTVAAQAGNNPVTVRVTDTVVPVGLFDTQSFTVAVAGSPTITSTPVTTATVDALYTYDVEATDPNAGDALTFSLDAAPAGMTIDPASGLIQWTPTNAQVGNNTVEVRVADPGGLFDLQPFNISVAANLAPSITSTPVTTATENVLYSYNVNALDDVDAEGSGLTFSLDVAPAGMTTDPETGLVQWMPTNAQIGDNSVTVKVTDTAGLFDSQSFTVLVGFANVAPSIISTPAVLTATAYARYTYDVNAVDDMDAEGSGLTFSLDAGAPVGMTINPATGLVMWTPRNSQAGDNVVTVRVTDLGGLFDTQQFTVLVEAVANPPPQLPPAAIWILLQ